MTDGTPSSRHPVKSSQNTLENNYNIEDLINNHESGSENYEELLKELEEKSQNIINLPEENKDDELDQKSSPTKHELKEPLIESPSPIKNSF